MVWRTPEHSEIHVRPGFQRAPPLDQFLLAARHLPGAVSAPTSADIKRHQLEVFGFGLEVVHLRERSRRIGKRQMRAHVFDRLALEINAPVIAEGRQVVVAASNRHKLTPSQNGNGAFGVISSMSRT
jgi:hypothetical protein